MFTEGTSGPRAIQTSSGQFVGVLHDQEEGHQVFGPYESFDEVIAVMRDYMTRELRKLEVTRLKND